MSVLVRAETLAEQMFVFCPSTAVPSRCLFPFSKGFKLCFHFTLFFLFCLAFIPVYVAVQPFGIKQIHTGKVNRTQTDVKKSYKPNAVTSKVITRRSPVTWTHLHNNLHPRSSIAGASSPALHDAEQRNLRLSDKP